ncbi:anthranilate synthase, aminase component [Geomicrobium sp. JCM 19037]|uniref:anthranilate synthase component I n=1 Tax=Geomicrobium sp. JCM 19037 TaxID=1460634 RepID=UPI00045F1BDD|nr:anthranilate synthase component I [Geomicrobium sp. JCM 19037]GAK02423.1 anthranilate synthase, aminase component [Geomicrobium sp. JCM 19037]
MITSFTTFQQQSEKYRHVPVIRQMFVDTITPIELYQRLSDEAVCLLESNDESSNWSHYSFIGLDPAFELTEKAGQFQFTSRTGDLIFSEKDPVVAFQRAFQHVNPCPGKEADVPFPGGAVGVLPYDSVKHLEKSLVSENDTDDESIHFVFCHTMICIHHKQSSISVIHYVDTREHDDEQALYNSAVNNIKTLVERINTSDEQSLPVDFIHPVSPDWTSIQSNYTKREFMRDVDRIKEYIQNGDVFQTVLSQRFRYETGVSAFTIYRVLRRVNPSPYLFFLKIGDKEIVGSSPEKLVGVEDGQVEIHPIAGTRKRGSTQAEDDRLKQELLASEKECAEHQMLVDLARNDIGRVSKYGTIYLPVLMEIGLFSHVMHIISVVRGQLNDNTHPLSALMAGFPAGTVSGAPKVRAMEILKELEPTKRGIYSGGIAYLGYNNVVDSCIAIRTMVVRNGEVTVQAGAGVVADSVPEEEYEETRNKAAALFSAIQTAEKMYERGAVTK